MAEGLSRLNQQVAASVCWTGSDRLGEPDARAVPNRVGSERERRRDDVRRTVEADIVPRLVLARSRAMSGPVPMVGVMVGAGEVSRFVELLLDHDRDASASVHVSAVQERGVSLADIYLHLFQPAARHIGEMWADDRCSFVDVTLAVGTMQKMLRAFEPLFQSNGQPVVGDRQALLVPLPGDQHTFGLLMVTEFFRRSGWSVWNSSMASFEDLGEAVRKAWFALVGFSASTDSRLDELATAIRLVRELSLNRTVGIMVGGPVFVEHPDYVARVGADAMGRDASEALVRAESFAAPAAIA